MKEREVTPRISGQDRWAATRRRGRFSFMVRYGILRFGLIVAALTVLDRYFAILPGSHWRGFGREVFGFAFTAIVGWALMGLLMWYSTGRLYRPDDPKREVERDDAPNF